MRALGWLALVLSTLGLTLFATACHPAVIPGTSAGSFAVTETLTTNACVGGFDPDPTLTYVIDIRADGNESYWHRGDQPYATGTYSPDGHFHFVATAEIQAYGADAGVAGAPAGCVLHQIETIDGTLALGVADSGVHDAGEDGGDPMDAGAGPDATTNDDAQAAHLDAGPDAGVHSTGFTGTDTIQLTIAAGSDCSALFATNGGPFSAIPCSAVYDMSGVAQ